MDRLLESGPRVVVVTGASAGVGRATAREFAKRGASVGLIARGVAGLTEAQREVESYGGRALVLSCDVSDADALEDAAARVERDLGPIDVWVNNAMVSVFSPVAEMTWLEFKRVTDVTYLGAVYGTLSALKRMRERDRGTIVQVGSALAYRAIPLQSAYCAAKHALRGFTDSLRSELLHDDSGIRLTMVHLPALNTPQFSWVKSRLGRRAQPVPPIFQPEVAAKAILRASIEAPRELFVGLPTWKAILGNKVAPALLDRYLARRGYDAQQTSEPDSGLRPNNLWRPLAEDRGAHGDFDARAKSGSALEWAHEHRGALIAMTVGAGAAAVGLFSRP